MRGLHHRTASSLTASTSTAHDLLCRVHLHHAARPPAANWTGLLAVSAWAATSGPAYPSSSLASWSQQRQRWAVQLFSTTNRRCGHVAAVMAGADEQLIGLEDVGFQMQGVAWPKLNVVMHACTPSLLLSSG